MRSFLMRTARSVPAFVATAGLVAGTVTIAVTFFLLSDVAAETGADGALQPSLSAMPSIGLPTMAAPLASPIAPAWNFDAALNEDAPNDGTPSAPAASADSSDMPAASPHPAARRYQTVALQENGLLIEPPEKPSNIALSINLDSMRLDALVDAAALDAASLDTYGLTTDEVSQIVEVKPGDTLIGLLVDAGATQEDAYAAVTALEPAFSPRELMPGQAVELTFASAQQPVQTQQETASFQLVGLLIQPSAERDVQVNRSFDGLFTVMEVAHPLLQTTVRGEGVIE
ncbi:MAG: hypothetical protein WEC00_13975, partial [Dongiaceae bacterium]